MYMIIVVDRTINLALLELVFFSSFVSGLLLLSIGARAKTTITENKHISVNE